jgi:hypothetical protein
MAIYTVHGGHAKQGNKYAGAVGYCAESVVDRAICASVIKWLQIAGHTAYDCTVDSGITQGNIISKIKKNINSYNNVIANISIHLNAVGKSKADGKVKGCECLVYSILNRDAVMGKRITEELKALGFTNRGVKPRTDLGVLKGITNGGMNVLVEVFFCDDEDDFNLYAKTGCDAIGKAIAQGIVGNAIPVSSMRAAKPTLRYGSNGTEAQKLQLNLNKVADAGLICDGKIGPNSVKALKKWQAACGLEADGIYGPLSYEQMQRLL